MASFRSTFKTTAELRLENIALRQQLGVLRRSARKRLKITRSDRLFWIWLRCLWTDWKAALVIVKPENVVAWRQKVIRIGSFAKTKASGRG
jgi:hypothetical protein